MRSVIIFIIILTLAALAIFSLTRLDSKMRNEYQLAEALELMLAHLEENGGVWPSSEKDLYGSRSQPSSVFIDYSISSENILENKNLLEKSIRLKSGDLQTYPHYKRDIQRIREAL